jgi:hypothetical protein
MRTGRSHTKSMKEVRLLRREISAGFFAVSHRLVICVTDWWSPTGEDSRELFQARSVHKRESSSEAHREGS